MKKIALVVILFTFLIESCLNLFAENFNLGMEEIDNATKRPTGWVKWGMDDFIVIFDSTIARSGKYSLRIEATDNAAEGSFGSSALSIPAIYEGKTVELRGYMKIENVSEGFAGLLLRIDSDDSFLEFDNMQNQNISGTHDWKQYTITLRYPAEGKSINVAGLLTGKGKIWLDDFEVFIDGKPLSEAPLKKEEIFKASLDTEFVDGSGIERMELNENIIGNLTILGKVWGFLKYYHPAVATGDYNWDFELFRIIPKIIECNDNQARNAILKNWINSLGSVRGEQKLEIDRENTKLVPDLKWIEDKTQFDDELITLLDRIKNAYRKDFNYYVDFAPNIKNPKFKHESSYSNMKFPDAGYRLLSLFRFWNIVQYFSPNRHLPDENWNNILPMFIPKLNEALGECDYHLAVLELLGSLDDTHTNINGYDLCFEVFRGVYSAPMQAKFIEDKYVVTDYLHDTYGKESGLEIGDVILKIDGKTIEELINEKKQFYPASNYPTKLRGLAYDLLRKNDKSTAEITYQHNSNIVNKEIKYYFNKDLKKISMFNKKDSCWKFINNDIGYIYPGKIKSDLIPEIMTAFEKTKGIVIDMRCYPAEFIVFSLGGFLVPEETEFVKFTVGNINYPGLFTFTEPLSIGGHNPYFYKGKIVILVNEITQSSAEYTTMAFWTAPKAIVMGSTTAGADGDVSQFNLPGGISSWISGIGILYPDGGETQRVGIIPDIVIRPTIKGIKEGRDEVLERAIEYIDRGE